MSGFGEKLRREREMRGVTLEEIAESTKIGTRSLRALEDEDFDKLPGGVFNRGFVRAYSKFVGLDEEQTVADFDTAWKQHQAANAPPPEIPVEEETESGTFAPSRLLVSAVILLAVAAAGWFFSKRQNDAKLSGNGTVPSAAMTQPTAAISTTQQNPTPTAAQTSPAVAPALNASQSGTVSATVEPPAPSKPDSPKTAAKSTPKGSDKSPDPPEEAKANNLSVEANAPIHLEVFAREDSWLSVSVDGKSLGQGILPAQKSRTIRAQREVHLRVGNVAGVEVSFNGRPISIAGEPKQVRELIFTPDGLRQ